MATHPSLIGAALLLAFAPALASDPGWEPVSAEQLEETRGGFTTPSGLELSLGIERLVSINGAVVARTSIQIADVRAVSASEAMKAQEALAATTLIQNGAGNMFSGDGIAGTFIQNTLSDQVIRSETVISSTVNSTSLLKDLNFNQSVRDAALKSIGTL
ncbi:hypothetical protein [Massilia cavernae]|uniref:Uncharacterized protein n=1 Tax=Massilia cavernae TaxID=2320864 RepID=A0A418XRF3_9BURK|nr:hypothetical protein [Massilia cavernae]RJG15076.1 hypothetical protein D3872_15315 [Massilia cavernae]